MLNKAATFGHPVNVITEYVRLKIYTARGKDKYGTVPIPYWRKSVVSGVDGHTINADGTVVELRKDAIFDKVVELPAWDCRARVSLYLTDLSRLNKLSRAGRKTR